MKTVPSLVASSTVGIAAAGLALGKPERSTPLRPSSSKKRKVGDLEKNLLRNSSSPISRPRPATSSTVITPDKSLPSTNGFSPAAGLATLPRSSNLNSDNTRAGVGRRRHTTTRHGDLSPTQEHIGDDARESVSSRGSWMRRLSNIPMSQNNSPRSSLGPDSPSFSNGSVAPILSDPGSSPAQLPPNKLVKRTISGKTNGGPRTRSGTSPQVPTFRRPATSHQRSFTLQQQLRREIPANAKDQDSLQVPHSQVIQDAPLSRTKHALLELGTTWRPFFDSRPMKLTKDKILSGRTNDGSMQIFQSTSRRVLPDETARPALVKPGMITPLNSTAVRYYEEDNLPFEEDLGDDTNIIVEEPVITSIEADDSQKRPRRSLSMHFGSPGSWIARSGSLRGKKQSTDTKNSGTRHFSAPVSAIAGRNTLSVHTTANTTKHRAITDPTVFQEQPDSPVIPDSNDLFSPTSFQARSRNTSSPLPPLSRLSSFNVDLARLGLSSSSSSAPRSPVLPTNTAATSFSSGRMSPSSATYFASLNAKSTHNSEIIDRASTLIGSDHEGKGFASGDDDDTDFQSETIYDSLRTTTTGSMRSHNAPLDSMFDESPPSISGHSKKRLSVHEMIGNGTFREGNKIEEEDEGMSTPVKGSRSRSSHEEGLRTPVRKPVDDEDPLPSSPPNFLLASKDFSGLSLDDGPEEEEDWNKDDENAEFGSPLSPPSHPSSSVNSRKVDPSIRAALADVTHTSTMNGKYAPPGERPRSNLFDWSEPPSIEKMDSLGNSPRPKTAHVKHMVDGRGGRGLGRRGPSALHIRSQSVPVVPDVAGQREHTKLTQKFGTWGLGGKGVSEDWDGDFDFDNSGTDDVEDGDSKLESSGMLVPQAIQASQANVVGHVGQIREVCLLVEDLKRLRILGREKNLLHGPSASLWKEAEGIIALAVPDEEDATLSPSHSPSSMDFDHEVIDDKFLEHGVDGAEVSKVDVPFEVMNAQGRPTGLLYDGNLVRRKSVFSPEDDIFGAGALVNQPQPVENLRPKPISQSTSPVHKGATNSTEVARSVMETMHQHRSTSDPLLSELTTQSSNKMPFDTTSLRDLVHRASVLSRNLAELIRKADGSPRTPEISPHRESSPAFTRVFTDPMASPPKHLPRSRSNNSVMSGSMDSSPSRSLGQRMQMMTVV